MDVTIMTRPRKWCCWAH